MSGNRYALDVHAARSTAASEQHGGKGDFMIIAVPVASMVVYRMYGNDTISLAKRQATDHFPAVH